MKSAIQNYISASKNLTKWCEDNGSIEQANELRCDRLNLAHGDGPAAVKVLKRKIIELGGDAVSSISISSNTTAAMKNLEQDEHCSESNFSQNLDNITCGDNDGVDCRAW